MLLTFAARELVLATWKVAPERVRRGLPPGLEPSLGDDGQSLVSVAALRNTDVRLAGRRGPSFSQLTVRTYVTRGGEPGVFFLVLRVTPPGLGGVIFGAPYRPARVRVRDGAVEAPGLGVSFRYRRTGAPPQIPVLESGPLGTHEIGYFVAAGLRRLVARHVAFAWEHAEPTAPLQIDLLPALGLDVQQPVSLLYAASTAFQVELPPEKVA